MSTNIIQVAGLSVELVRKPIKNLHIGVYPPSGHIRVATPLELSNDAVKIAIIKRLDWVKNKQREFLQQARQSERQYVSGETHFVFGRPRRLVVETMECRRCTIRIEGSDRLAMVVPEGSSSQQKAKWMANWYRSQLTTQVTPRISKIADGLGLPTPEWRIRSMKTKWGSCNVAKELIWLNLELAKKPVTALEYVILHEMAHFITTKHDATFVAVLDAQMPSWRQVRADLNALPLS